MWYEIRIKTQSNALEAIYPILFNRELTGIVTEDPNDPIYSDTNQGDWDYFEEEARQFDYEGALIKAYIELEQEGQVDELLKTLESDILRLKQFGFDPQPAEVSALPVVEEDWANEWKKYYHSFEIADSIIIKPAWEDYQAQADEIVVSLDSGRAFGTGTHETTSLCVQMIQKYAEAKESFYDLGCGSGILAIVAKKLAFKQVYGVDIDPIAVEASIANSELNFGDQQAIDFALGTVDNFKEKADMIVSNIIADVIIAIAPKVKQLLKKHSIYIASGILDSKAEEVKQALLDNNYSIVEVAQAGEWVTIVSRLADE